MKFVFAANRSEEKNFVLTPFGQKEYPYEVGRIRELGYVRPYR